VVSLFEIGEFLAFQNLDRFTAPGGQSPQHPFLERLKNDQYKFSRFWAAAQHIQHPLQAGTMKADRMGLELGRIRQVGVGDPVF
jgi:hypothetical protein